VREWVGLDVRAPRPHTAALERASLPFGSGVGARARTVVWVAGVVRVVCPSAGIAEGPRRMPRHGRGSS